MIAQCRDASTRAIADDDLAVEPWDVMDAWLAATEPVLVVGTLDVAATRLGAVCGLFPRGG